eukprot:CAMPEP_0172324096 /NCGR_PEP_ID=MMETSP1058-20130122/50439_1 /TAXON_ID=83371 /ORGANISM="Detonula confervacea, Strain CCMP 353" /LENGTH=484 /DNA_ID=CAMNT_0013040275 /DNA_START=226 /DNA_END=1680 /DNA_ORIENTATION=+
MTLKSKMEQEREPSMSWVMVCAALYVLSGVTQPILMSYAQHAGLANPRCQLYMLFYYIGPASVAFTMRCRRRRISHEKKDHLNEDANGGTNNHDTKCTNHDEQQFLSSGNSNNDGNSNNIQSCSNEQCTGNGTSYGATAFHNHGNNNNEVIDDGYEYEKEDEERSWPSQSLLVKTSSIALFDIFAQSMTYTGNNFAGPTIFSIIYSSVTIWTALYSKFLLSRSLSKPQWMGVCIVVAGLSLTAMDSLAVGESVFFGACLILVGSSFHGLTYVLSEKIMTSSVSSSLTTPTACIGSSDATTATTQIKNHNTRQESQHVSVRANCSIQGGVATAVLLLWQLFYTLPRLQHLILDPMADAGTTPLQALAILFTIALSNLLHSVTFFATLKYFPGGATSEGVLKGLQAVLVFAASAIALCGRWGGIEMCWSRSKFVSLVVVVCGILLYGTFTEKGRRKNATRRKSVRDGGVYKRVGDVSGDDGKIMCV